MKRASVMTRLGGRATMWVLVIWSAYIATWAWVSDSSPAVVAAWWLAGFCVLQGLARDSAPSDAARRGLGESAETASVVSPTRTD